MSGGFRVGQTTPATNWELIQSFPHTFTNGRFPKALFLNVAGNVTLVDATGNSVVFTPVAGVPIQVRPTVIQASAVDVIALFD